MSDIGATFARMLPPVVDDDAGTVVAHDGTKIDWDDLAHGQGSISSQLFSDQYEQPRVVALEDKKHAGNGAWRQLLVVVDSRAGFVRVYDKWGMAISEPSSGRVVRGKQELAQFVAQFDTDGQKAGCFYRSPAVRRRPADRSSKKSKDSTERICGALEDMIAVRERVHHTSCGLGCTSMQHVCTLLAHRTSIWRS